MKNRFILGLISISMIWFLNSCQKPDAKTPSIPKTFIKTFDTDSSAQTANIEQFPNGNFLLTSSKGAGLPLLIETDQYGNQLWQKTIPNLCLFSAQSWNVYNSPDLYHIMMQSGPIFTQTDNMGNILNQADLRDKVGIISGTNFGPLLANATNYFVTLCNGQFTGSPSDNNVYAYDKNLKYIQKFTFPDNDIGGKNLWFCAYDYKVNTSAKICGYKFPRTKWTWNDNYKVYCALIKPGSKTIETIVDSGDLRHSDNIQWLDQTPDSGLIISSLRTDNLKNTNYPTVMKFDKNTNLNWEKEYQVDNKAVVITNISVCSGGGYLLLGYIGIPTSYNNEPYVIKIDANGNKEWDKAFTSAYGSFYAGMKTADGGYALVGFTTSFGKGKNGPGILFVKTDSRGNL